MKRTGIVLAGMPRLMLEVMDGILASHPDLYVAGRVPADDNLRDAVRRHRAHVLIIMQPDGAGLASGADRMFWCRPSKVIAIAASGRKGALLVLRPHTTPFRELSAESLIDALRSAGDA